ncbi:MAG: nitrate reductase [Gammaproteobacteria bacterium]|nr:nitrate reductase [Gammaproteobacteria bacterium]
MVFVTGLFAFLFYAATAILLAGVASKITQYWRTPSPLKIPTTPAPKTRSAVVFRMGRELVFFETLYRSDKWTWFFGWMFHLGLFLVLARHLRYFTEPVWGWVAQLQPLGKYGAFAMVGGLIGLWARRLLVDRVRYISRPSDHLMLALLVGIAGSGLIISYITYTDIVAVKAFFLGLMRIDWGYLQTLPADIVLIAHLMLAIALMAVFPFSKLLHAPGIFFSPTLNQVDDARERRHLAPWASKLDASRKK